MGSDEKANARNHFCEVRPVVCAQVGAFKLFHWSKVAELRNRQTELTPSRLNWAMNTPVDS